MVLESSDLAVSVPQILVWPEVPLSSCVPQLSSQQGAACDLRFKEAKNLLFSKNCCYSILYASMAECDIFNKLM